MRWRRAFLSGFGLSLFTWGVVDARLTFGAVPDRLTIIFDGSCDLCTLVIRRIAALDRHRRVTIAPFQQPALPESVGLTYAQCEETIWAVTPDGRPYGTAQAVNLIFATILRSPLVLWFYGIPGIRQLQERGYRLVAANRHRFPGDIPYCEQHPEDCGLLAAH
jgi:predicted DCC family thiol-disulfide oxidoreductase YuxK